MGRDNHDGKGLAGNVRHFLLLLVCGTLLTAACSTASAQVAPLAPRWLAGTPPPPVETFADGLARHHIELTEAALIAALQDPDGEVRSLAAAQLAAMDDHPALTAILGALVAESDPQVEVNLAGAATWLGSRRALDQLQRLCQDLNVPSTARLDAARYVSNKELPTCFPAVEQIERTEAGRKHPRTGDHGRGQLSRAERESASPGRLGTGGSRSNGADCGGGRAAVPARNQRDGRSRPRIAIEGDDTAREHLREAIRDLRLASADADNEEAQ